jgi:hypothetical protein
VTPSKQASAADCLAELANAWVCIGAILCHVQSLRAKNGRW